MALFDDQDYGNNEHFKNLFLQNDNCLVKGLVFMGTPFNGTGTADLFIPFIRTIRQLNVITATNDSFLSALSKKQPVNIDRVVNQALGVIRQRNIMILIGCEERPVTGSRLVRMPTPSAMHAIIGVQLKSTDAMFLTRSPPALRRPAGLGKVL